MENNNTDIQTGTQTGAEGAQEKTFTQDEVNRIVQDRLAREKGKGSEELDKREAALNYRERKMNAVDELRKNGLPDYLAEALNLNTDEDFQKSMEAIKRMKGESAGVQPGVIGKGSPIGDVGRGYHDDSDQLRGAFGLKQVI